MLRYSFPLLIGVDDYTGNDRDSFFGGNSAFVQVDKTHKRTPVEPILVPAVCTDGEVVSMRVVRSVDGRGGSFAEWES